MTNPGGLEPNPIYLEFTSKTSLPGSDHLLYLSIDQQLRSTDGFAFIKGRIKQENDEDPTGWVDSFLVQDSRNGTGSRLLKAFIVALLERGVNELWSTSISPQALNLRMKLFGGKLLDFYDLDEWGEPHFLPITAEQALQSAELADAKMIEPLGARMDISGLDISDWEGPTDVKEVYHDPSIDLAEASNYR